MQWFQNRNINKNMAASPSKIVYDELVEIKCNNNNNNNNNKRVLEAGVRVCVCVCACARVFVCARARVRVFAERVEHCKHKK